MPNNTFQPNDPRYYDAPAQYPMLDILLGGNHAPTDDEEREVYNQNNDNLMAFLISQIPGSTEDPNEISQIFKEVPGYRNRDPHRDARNQLSELAREQILKLAMDFWTAPVTIPPEHRQYRVLLNRSQSQKDLEHDERVLNTLQNGTPRQKGQLFDACVKNCRDWFNKGVRGLSDRQIVANLKQLQKVLDVALEANAILALADSQDEAKRIEITAETREMLQYMNQYSVQMSINLDRIRAIANPTYTYMDVDSVMELSNAQFEQVQDKVNSTDQPFTSDYLKVLFRIRSNASIVRDADKEEFKACLDEVVQANKGFFIGSRAYSGALRSLRNVYRFMENMDTHPSAEELEQVIPMLQTAIGKCSNYLANKNPNAFKNAREQRRYHAMKRMMDSCLKTLDFLNMKETRKSADKLSFYRPNADVAYPEHSLAQVQRKIQENYGVNQRQGNGNATVGKIAPSDVGDIADRLREEIYQQLNTVVKNEKSFNQDNVRTIMASMAVLEMVKRGRSRSLLGNFIAGPVERKLAEDPVEMVTMIQENNRFVAMTRNVTPQMLRHFIVADGAKAIADSMIQIGKSSVPSSNEEPELRAGNKIPVSTIHNAANR